MSSAKKYFKCPNCGCESAYREQDNRTCEISYGCPNCSWRGEPVEQEKVLTTYYKFVTGYVAQQFVKKGNKFICVSQNFVAENEVTRENEAGDGIIIDTSQEVYFPFDMKQPRKGRI
jgi:hypothetical protein